MPGPGILHIVPLYHPAGVRPSCHRPVYTKWLRGNGFAGLGRRDTAHGRDAIKKAYQKHRYKSKSRGIFFEKLFWFMGNANTCIRVTIEQQILVPGVYLCYESS